MRSLPLDFVNLIDLIQYIQYVICTFYMRIYPVLLRNLRFEGHNVHLLWPIKSISLSAWWFSMQKRASFVGLSIDASWRLSIVDGFKLFFRTVWFQYVLWNTQKRKMLTSNYATKLTNHACLSRGTMMRPANQNGQHSKNSERNLESGVTNRNFHTETNHKCIASLRWRTWETTTWQKCLKCCSFRILYWLKRIKWNGKDTDKFVVRCMSRTRKGAVFFSRPVW